MEWRIIRQTAVIMIMAWILGIAFSPAMDASEDFRDIRVRFPDDIHLNPQERSQWTREFAQTFFDQNIRQMAGSTWSGYFYEDRAYLQHFHALLEDGTLWGWGLNFQGQLGDGTTQNRAEPIVTLESVFTALQGYALGYDGSAWVWGINQHGEIGDGTLANRLSPFRVMDNVVSITHTGRLQRSALRADGSLWSWGRNHTGQLGDGTLIDRHSPVQILDNVVFIGSRWVATDIAGGIALRADGSLWAWGRHAFDGDITFDSPTPTMIVSDFVPPPVGQTTFTADDGIIWYSFSFARQLRPTDVALANLSFAEYLYAPTQNRYMFEPSPPILLTITDPITAQAEIARTISSLTSYQRTSGDALNLATLHIENVSRRGTSQAVPDEGTINTELLIAGAMASSDILQVTGDILTYEELELLRGLRDNINFISEATEEIQVEFPNDISNIAFDNVTVEAEFAMVTINRTHIPQGGEISIRIGQTNEARGNDSGVDIGDKGMNNNASDRGVLDMLISFWSIAVVSVTFVSWLVLTRFGKKFPIYIVIAVSAVAITANVGTAWLGSNEAEQDIAVIGTAEYTAASIDPHDAQLDEAETNRIEVTMTEGMRATLSLPVNGTDPEFLILFNEQGEIQNTKYNPVTGNIDANIRESGVYILREHRVNFADIENKSQLMQDAILRLTSRDIMRGTMGDYFSPDELITRAEFAAAIVMAFDMIDFDARSSFVDLSPSDWFYHAIATAEREGLIGGFEDNTFRGELDMYKDQLIVVAANTLIEQMGYHVPYDIESILSVFLDRPILAEWSEDGIALATSSNVVIFRTDSMFAPLSNKTRGDAAIVLYRVFSRVW